jgi:hypothetical protein
MRLAGLLVVGLGVSFAIAAYADCGPFGVFKDSDYCISCSGKTFKENSCPGGDVGLTAEGVTHPNCQISYYSPATCRVNAKMTRNLLADLKKGGHLVVPLASPADQARYNASLSKPK